MRRITVGEAHLIDKFDLSYVGRKAEGSPTHPCDGCLHQARTEIFNVNGIMVPGKRCAITWAPVSWRESKPTWCPGFIIKKEIID